MVRGAHMHIYIGWWIIVHQHLQFYLFQVFPSTHVSLYHIWIYLKYEITRETMLWYFGISRALCFNEKPNNVYLKYCIFRCGGMEEFEKRVEIIAELESIFQNQSRSKELYILNFSILFELWLATSILFSGCLQVDSNAAMFNWNTFRF